MGRLLSSGRSLNAPGGWLRGGCVAGLCLLMSCAQGMMPSRSVLDRQVQQVIAEVQQQMVLIPGGSYQMGSARADARAVDLPAHAVTVRPFKMGRFEITVRQYSVFARATGRDRPNGYFGRLGQHPVTQVTWDDAKAFAAWVSRQTGSTFRLPTEAEWEYAARAGSVDDYYWGNAFNASLANSSEPGDGWAQLAPVGSFPANAFGLHDMLGNVWEWLEDCATYHYLGAPADGSAWLTGDCGLHAVRGGSWYYDPNYLRVTVRNWDETSVQLVDLGFRLAQDL